MYVYRSFEKGLYTTGFYGPDDNFNPVDDHDNEADAQRQVARLNGGGEESAPTAKVEVEVKTLRDEMAMAALTGLLAAHSADGQVLPASRRTSKWAYEYADAMMLARKEIAADAE